MPEFQPLILLSNLTGKLGFKITGEHQYDQSGISVAAAGDINGDGFADLIIGSDYASYSPHDDNSSKTYVIFGSAEGFGPKVELSGLDGSNGFQITGQSLTGIYSYSSNAVASAGDVNGDGFADLLIGDAYAEKSGSSYYPPSPGAAHVVFGGAGGFPADFSLDDLDGANGFKIAGELTGDFTGIAVSTAGDLNGDGIDDIVIGASSADAGGSRSGNTYVVFGSTKGFGAELQLSDLDGANGFRVIGEAIEDRSGCDVASGDINGDGIADLIIGANGADANGASSGAAYVVFGRDTGFAANLHLSSLNGANGFQISGEAAGDQAGDSVALAGDLNADGFDDIIIGARFADPHGSASGAAYVVFGHGGGFSASLDLGDLDGSNGFKMSGNAENDWFGRSVASAGDVNGDGYDDLIVGASLEDANGGDSGAAYVVFGKAGGFAADLQLGDLDGSNGFKIAGESYSDFAGRSVSSAGDLNGDGFDDLIIGATGANPNGGGSGASYVIYGHRANEAVTRIGTAIDNVINGGRGGDLVRGLSGDDHLIGWEGADRIFGGFGEDRINGRAGRDIVSGGSGRDILLGGFAADIFDFNQLADSGTGHGNRDVIRDFGLGKDRIDLADLGALDFIGTAEFSGAGEVRVVQHGEDALVRVNLSGESGAEMSVLLRNVDAAGLTAEDFIL
jgi:hypothetical protein